MRQLLVMANLCLLIVSTLTLTSCRRSVMPKPYAYARLTYLSSDYLTACFPGNVCRFEYPSCFVPTLKQSGAPGAHWVDFRFEKYGITLYTSYMQLDNRSQLDEQRLMHEALLEKKLPPYTTVSKKALQPKQASLHIDVYEVNGTAAIPFEFLITDNQLHCFSGKVLFDTAPDRDSLAEILNGLSKDMIHLMGSFEFTHKP